MHGPTCIVMEGAPLQDEEFENLRSAAAIGDSAKVRSIISAHPKQVSINVARAAIQIMGCDGNIVAHLPLPNAH